MKYTVVGGEMSHEEMKAYMDMLRKKYPARIFTEVTFKIDGDYVDIDYKFDSVPFNRIRRITGYLVGTLDRFNDAKRAEEADRVKHAVPLH